MTSSPRQLYRNDPVEHEAKVWRRKLRDAISIRTEAQRLITALRTRIKHLEKRKTNRRPTRRREFRRQEAASSI